MTESRDAATHQLPEEQLRRIFLEDILPNHTGTTQENPVVLFITGQPGAGKSTVESQVLRQLGLDDAVAVDGDDLFLYHPDYYLLAAEDDRPYGATLRCC